MSKIPGYAGLVLTVDLSERKHEVAELPLALVEEYIGGKGFAAKVLYDQMVAGCNPLSPENIVVIACGPLTGTLAPTGCRSVLATKSPLTGIWLDSNCGGTFGSELKAAGFDLLIIKGASEKPVKLVITDGQVEIQDAAELWGGDDLTGREEMLYAALAVGAKGAMTATVGIVPEYMTGIYRAWREGDKEKALKLQFAVLQLIRAMFALPFPLGFKAALELRGFRMGKPKRPLSDADQYNYQKVKSRIEIILKRMNIERTPVS